MKQAFCLTVALALSLTASMSAAPVTGLDAIGGLQTVVSSDAAEFTYSKLESGIQFRINGVTKNVIFYGPETVRVNANLGENHWDFPSIVVVGEPAKIPFDVKDGADELTITSDKLRIVADKKTGALSFYDALGKLYVQEKDSEPETVKEVTISGKPTYEVANTFTLKPDEGIYGFGFVDAANTNRRGRQLLLVQTNVGIIIPMMVSTENYGIMWDTYSKMTFKDDAHGATLWAESAPGGVDYYFFGGPNMDQVIAEYRQLTGAAPMYPKQAFGLFMSKERYKDQARLLEVARTFREKKFPVDYMVQDWQYWGSDKDGTWSGMIWNPERYPDPEAMIKELHDMNMKLMISIWPGVGNDTELAKALDAKGLRFEPLHWISKKARIYDAFSPEGRKIYWDFAKKGLFDKGVDALWMDGTEVEVGTACWNPKEVERDIKNLGNNAMGDFTRYLNPYTLMTTKGTYEGQRAANDKRVFTLTRSAWAGAQRYAAASWSGDIFASWNTLKEQVSGGVNVTMAGNPYWTQDTGGFFVTQFPGGQDNAAYQELFTRWFQYAAFNPLMRIHGTNIEREPYVFADKNPEMYQVLLDTAHLRYRLLPYIYSLSSKVTNEGYTLMRGIAMDFGSDPKVRSINDEFMFGPAFLVQPVTRPMYHVAEPPPATVPAEALTTAEGGEGIAVQYFKGTDFETPAGSAVDAKVEYNWPGPPLAGPPPGLTGFDKFSGRWEGMLTASETGDFEIGVEFDDGARLFVDNKLIVDDWGFGPKRYKSAKVALTKGQKVPVKIEFHQGGLDRYLRFAWRTPSAAKELTDKKEGLNTAMQTYLPVGPAKWYDFWTNKTYPAGETVTTGSPLNRFPIFVRAGSIVPMGPAVQYATENPGAPYEVRIYPGADARFTIYEDDNETYAYEKGQRATFDLIWNDAARTLSIGERQGSYPGMTPTRTLNLVLATEGANAGIGGRLSEAKTITYDGKPVSVSFSR